MQIKRLKAASTMLAIAAIAITASPASSADGVVMQLINGLYDTRDKLQEVVTKSVKPVAEAMREAESSDAALPNENSGSYMLRKYGELNRVYTMNATNSKAQLNLLKIDTKLLKLIPSDDPRRAEILKELGQLPVQNQEVNKKLKEYGERRQAFHDELQNYKKRTGSYPPHNCATAPGWHLPQGASCEGSGAADPAASPAPSPAPSGHHGP